MIVSQMRPVLFALMAIVSTSAVCGQTDAKQDFKLLAGAWRVVTFEIHGKAMPAEKSPKDFVIVGDQLTGLGPPMVLTLDPTKKPKWVDLTFKKDDKSYPLRGIYEVNGEDLKLCIPMAEIGKLFENKRPQSFDTVGKGTALFLAKRISKK